MWKFTIKQDGVICALGRMKNKDDCLRECFNYLNSFANEDFSKFTMEIFKAEVEDYQKDTNKLADPKTKKRVHKKEGE